MTASRKVQPHILVFLLCVSVGWFCCAGTPAYFSAEMVESHRFTAEIDDWCLGVALYQMLQNRLPVDNDNDIVWEPLDFSRSLTASENFGKE